VRPIDNLALEFSDVQFITAEEDPNTPPPVNVRHDGAFAPTSAHSANAPARTLLRRRLPLGLRSRVSTGTRIAAQPEVHLWKFCDRPPAINSPMRLRKQ